MAALDEFVAIVRRLQPTIAVVLGSGQSAVLSEMQETSAIHFADVPDLPAPTVAGHSGRIAVGTLDAKPLLVFQGRVHFYEGHSWDKVAAPIRFAANLGIRQLLLTNAAGGIHPSLGPGSLMILRDHLFWQCLGSWKDSRLSLREMPSPYSVRLNRIMQEAARAQGDELIEGIYAAVTGPCYETPAEIRALKTAGADAVGMSTAHEANTANELGIECAALSAITNKGAGLTDQVLDHREVLQVMGQLRERMGRLIAKWIRRLPVS